MKRSLARILGLALVAALLGSSTPDAAAAGAAPTAAPANPKAYAPGLELAQNLSMITGVAISPLMGVGAVGAWKYFQTPAGRRASLPWFAQPYFWIPALLLVGLVFAKDALGPVVPTALKKPFDVAEVFENKVSALVAAGAFVPLMISVFPSTTGGDSSALGTAGFAAINFGAIGNALLTPIALAVFVVVWLAAHAINILILLSPFATVDAGLKAFRLFLLSTIAGASFANPYWGAVWSLIIVVLCYLVAGWSFRMTAFGTVFAWDLLTLRRLRFRPNPAGNWAFLSRKVDKIPIRTYGRLVREASGQLRFEYRPWLVLPKRHWTLPAGTYVIGRALLHPELLERQGDTSVTWFKFPPRCRTHDAALSQIYTDGRTEDTGLVAAWRWLKELFGASPTPATSPQPA